MENMEEGHMRKRQISPNEKILESAILYHIRILLGIIAFATHSHPILQDCLCKTVSFFTK